MTPTNWTKRETEFPAVVTFRAPDAFIIGTYKGSEQVPQKNGRALTSHTFVLGESTGAAFKRNGNYIEVAPGQMVSLSGQRLDRALSTGDIGAAVKIIYLGREAKGTNGKNPAHLFEVLVASLA